eukprot:1156356-Pelagomonas_calceolata.AAC.2
MLQSRLGNWLKASQQQQKDLLASRSPPRKGLHSFTCQQELLGPSRAEVKKDACNQTSPTWRFTWRSRAMHLSTFKFGGRRT